jgi:hypothetical protein
MEVREARETGLFSCRIDFGEFFGAEKEAEWVKLREATAGELAKIAVGDGAKASEAFMALLPALVLESSFTVEAKPASPEAVADIIKSKGTLFTYVITEWQQSLPLPKGKSKKSER